MKTLLGLLILTSQFAFAQMGRQCPPIDTSEENIKASTGNFTRQEIEAGVRNVLTKSYEVTELGGAPQLLRDNSGCFKLLNAFRFLVQRRDGCQSIHTVMIWDQSLEANKDKAEVRIRPLSCQNDQRGGKYELSRK